MAKPVCLADPGQSASCTGALVYHQCRAATWQIDHRVRRCAQAGTKAMTIGTVHAIYIGPKRGQPLVGGAEGKAGAGRGLEGDPYCLGPGSPSGWPGPGRHVTLIE